jgi:hypothetical protein
VNTCLASSLLDIKICCQKTTRVTRDYYILSLSTIWRYATERFQLIVCEIMDAKYDGDAQEHAVKSSGQGLRREWKAA